MLLGSKWAATSPLKQKCSKKKYQKDCWGLFKLTKLHVQSIWKRAVENEWHFLPAWFISWKPQHEALLDLPGVNAVGQVTTWISKSILHSQAVSSLSWPLYDKKHFAKKQPYLLAQEINYWSRRGSLSAPKQHSTFFFLSYFPLKLAALQKMSWRHPKKLLLLEKLPSSLSLLVHPSGLKQFPHCGSERVPSSQWRRRSWRQTALFWHLLLMQPPPVLLKDHLSPVNSEKFCFGLVSLLPKKPLTTLGIHLVVIQSLNFPDNFLFPCCQQLHCY